MKKLLLLTTGGTIASVETENGLAPAATPQELLSYIPQADTFCEVDVRQLFNIDSTNIQPEHWTRIALEIETSFTDYDGFVITAPTPWPTRQRRCPILCKMRPNLLSSLVLKSRCPRL